MVKFVKVIEGDTVEWERVGWGEVLVGNHTTHHPDSQSTSNVRLGVNRVRVHARPGPSLPSSGD
jgi:hypothetical protein